MIMAIFRVILSTTTPSDQNGERQQGYERGNQEESGVYAGDAENTGKYKSCLEVM